MELSIHNYKNSNIKLTQELYENYKQEFSRYIQMLDSKYVSKKDFFEKLDSGICFDIYLNQFIDFASEVAESMSTKHYHYGKLSASIYMNYIRSITLNSFSKKVDLVYKNGDFYSQKFYDLVTKHREIIDKTIDYSKDDDWTYFALLTLKRAYLITLEGVLIERPQDMLMRVALQLHETDINMAIETYKLLSDKYYTHGSPTLFNAGSIQPQLASCFLVTPIEESVEGLFDTIKRCVKITESGGGLAIELHDISAKGSAMKKTGGISKGIIPYIQVLRWSTKYIGQAGNRRSGCPAIYLEPWHKDIFDFLDLRKNVGVEELRARDIFTALWVNDLFMERVNNNEDWSLFCPKDAPKLSQTYGEEFKRYYLMYEQTVNRTVVPAQKVWKAIISSQIETGTPYMLYKDTINKNSNQKNIGIIRTSNLCAEIVQHTSAKEVAVCNLASICLPKFVQNGEFDFDLFRKVVKIVTRNVNRVIDCNVYPIKEAEYSNRRNRPVGLGIQGLADVFIMLRLPFESNEARVLNREIFETLYFAALEASCEEAQKYGPYETYEGSPISQGIFHWELANSNVGDRWNWEELRANILKYGVRNSLLIAPMPTAGTSQIFNNNEAFEPFTSNIYTRKTAAGEFQMVNRYLMEDLISLNLWSLEMKNLIISHDGSIQNIPNIPEDIKALYKTVWEIKMKSIIDLAADRQPFIDQSQSLNIFMANPSYSALTSMHFYGWKKGLKTGMYYLRTRPITSAIKYTVDPEIIKKYSGDCTEEKCDACSC